MRRVLAAGIAALVLTGCTATMREGHPEDIPAAWHTWPGTRHLNVIMAGDPDEDWEWFAERCDAMGGQELIATRVDPQGNVLTWQCDWVDF